MDILIVKFGALGDVVRTLSLLEPLSRKYVGASIDWWTDLSALPFFAGNPFVRHVFEQKPDSVYDLVINLEEDPQICQQVITLGKKIVGTFFHDGIVSYTPSLWFDMSLVSRFGKGRANVLKKENVSSYQMHIYTLLGLTPPIIPPFLSVDTEFVRNFSHRYAIGSLVIGINTGAGSRWRYKRWGVSSTIRLIDALRDEYPDCTVLLFGGADEKDRNEFILHSVRTNVIPCDTAESLRKFISLLSLCDVLVTSDSLALHIGSAFDTRIVAFFGPTSGTEIELYGRGEKLVSPIGCQSCYLSNCEKMVTCMDMIPLSVMMAAVERQIGFLPVKSAYQNI